MFLNNGAIDKWCNSNLCGSTQRRQKETEEVPVDAHYHQLIINGTNKSVSFIVNSTALPGKKSKITAPNGFTVSPTVLPANKENKK